MRIIKKVLFLIICYIYILPIYAFNVYSTDELDQLEKEFIQLINQSNQVNRNPLSIQYINHIGKTLLNSLILRPYLFIVKSNEINAFAGPGGYIGVNSQLILTTENESELAAVIAHELAHVKLHHLYQAIQHQKQMQVPMLASLLASVALGVIDPMLASGAIMASLTGFTQNNINFTRSNEKEADRIGINLLIHAGFNPYGMINFFKKMQINSRYYYTANIPAILRAHPLDEERIAEAENRCFAWHKHPVPDHLEYHLFKELIRNEVNSDDKQLMDYYNLECVKHSATNICLYGKTLLLLHRNQFKIAQENLSKLLQTDSDNLFYQIAMANAEIGSKDYVNSLHRLQELQKNYPDNYATLRAYAEGLILAKENTLAISILIKGFRQFKYDLPLCEMLAQAQAHAGQKDYAYFTQAQCYILQGRRYDALRQLQQAKKLLKPNNHYLSARIDAAITDIKN